MTEVVTGAVKHSRVNEDKGYYSLLVKDEWYNGELPEKKNALPDFDGKVVKINTNGNEDDFINIDSIENVKGRDNEDASNQRENSDATESGEGNSNGGKDSAQQFVSERERQRSIQAQVALKQAREEVQVSYEDDPAQHLEQVHELAQGYCNILETLVNEGDE